MTVQTEESSPAGRRTNRRSHFQESRREQKEAKAGNEQTKAKLKESEPRKQRSRKQQHGGHGMAFTHHPLI